MMKVAADTVCTNIIELHCTYSVMAERTFSPRYPGTRVKIIGHSYVNRLKDSMPDLRDEHAAGVPSKFWPIRDGGYLLWDVRRH